MVLTELDGVPVRARLEAVWHPGPQVSSQSCWWHLLPLRMRDRFMAHDYIHLTGNGLELTPRGRTAVLVSTL